MSDDRPAVKRGKHPGGRPPIAPEERQTVVINVRLTPDLADALYLHCLRRSVTTSGLIRKALVEIMARDAEFSYSRNSGALRNALPSEV